ncbi:MAG: hypothetical protein K2N90_04970 [Lachnospiraceae bacterium]|nr:hypothetical protein [Lachnospiraceae bacterium]
MKQTKSGDGIIKSCSPFSAAKCNGKNPNGKGRVDGTGRKQGLFSVGRYVILINKNLEIDKVTKNGISKNRIT